MNEIFKSKRGWVLGALAFLIVFFIAFGLGVSVGYRKAIFSSDWGRNYERNFSNIPPLLGMMGGPPMNAHGTAGTVIDVSTSSISVQDNDNDERLIVVATDTIIKKMSDMVSLHAITVGDHVVVIGVPNANGQVEARLIRVFPVSGLGSGGPQP